MNETPKIITIQRDEKTVSYNSNEKKIIRHLKDSWWKNCWKIIVEVPNTKNCEWSESMIFQVINKVYEI